MKTDESFLYIRYSGFIVHIQALITSIMYTADDFPNSKHTQGTDV